MEEITEIENTLDLCDKLIHKTFPHLAKNKDKDSEINDLSKDSHCKGDSQLLVSPTQVENDIASGNNPKTIPTLETKYSTIYARCGDMYMDSRHLQSFLNPHMWVETEHIDYCLRHKSKKTKTNTTVTRAAYTMLMSRERNEWQRARRFQVPWDEELTLLDVQSQDKHLHPLFMMNHFVLLELRKQTKTCVIYDSMMIKRETNFKGTLHNDRQIIKEFALPDFFMDENEHKTWQVIHYDKMPQQFDEISCGVYVISAAADIINGREIQNISCVTAQRMAIVKDILTTTEEGQSLLRIAKSDDDLLFHIKADANQANKAYQLRQNRYFKN